MDQIVNIDVSKNGYGNQIYSASATKVVNLVNVLKKSGFSLTEEQQQYLDGTHEAYV